MSTVSSCSGAVAAHVAKSIFYVSTVSSCSGAVAADGQIEPGDMLLEVNDVNFENMTNDDAVKTLRDIVQTPG